MKHAIIMLGMLAIGCQDPTISIGGMLPPDIETAVICVCEGGKCTVFAASSIASGRIGVAFGEADLCRSWSITIQREDRASAARDMCASQIVPRVVRDRIPACEQTMLRLFEANERLGVGGADAQ